MGREAIGDVADGVPEAIEGGFSGLTQQRLQLGKGVLDGIEVGAVRRKVEPGYLLSERARVRLRL